MFDVLKHLLCTVWFTFCNNDQRLRGPHQDLEENIHYMHVYIVLNEGYRYYRHSASMSWCLLWNSF